MSLLFTRQLEARQYTLNSCLDSHLLMTSPPQAVRRVLSPPTPVQSYDKDHTP